MEQIKIVIADAQLLMREGLQIIIDLEEDMYVAGCAAAGMEALQMASTFQPDLMLVDVSAANLGGVAVIANVHRKYPDIKLLMMSTFLEERTMLEGLSSGAVGYLLKDTDADAMLNTIRRVMDGSYALPPSVQNRLNTYSREVGERSNQGPVWPQLMLTPREFELANYLVQGVNNRTIADSLHLSERTIRNYVSQLYTKLKVRDRGQAIRFLSAIL